MQIIYKKIEDIIPYENNPRINDNAVDYVANSIKEFGFKVPIIIDKNNVIVTGHTRLKSAKKLGLKEVPTIMADDLTEEQIKAFRLADNKVSEFASWDFGKLDLELENLDIDMSDFGFDLNFDVEEEKEIIEDEVPDVPEEPKAKLGDIYQLGNHRLMCGDSTKEEDIDKLMNGERADIMFTSPPYNTMQGETFEARGKAKGKSGNYYSFDKTTKEGPESGVYGEYQDDLSDEQYINLLCKANENGLKYCDDTLLNIGILKGSKQGIIGLLNNFKDKFLDILIWNKSRSFPIAFDSQYGAVGHRCELIFCFNQKGNRKFTHPQWEKGTQINRIDTPNASGNEYAKQHGATFPVELPYNIIKDYTETSCLDLFGGTGTTMIACEQLNRKCYMMELDPHYIDLIIQRWENFTGEKAVKLK